MTTVKHEEEKRTGKQHDKNFIDVVIYCFLQSKNNKQKKKKK